MNIGLSDHLPKIQVLTHTLKPNQTVEFHKYTGCGNDFILIDNRADMLCPSHLHGNIPLLCHRQKGIGADGVIFLENSLKADYKMRIFNADGSEAEMCGNGIRCLMAFIHELDPSMHSCLVETMNSFIPVEINAGWVKAAMPDPIDIHWGLPLEAAGVSWSVDYLNTGVPHAVVFVEDLEAIDVVKLGREIRLHSKFHPKGANANFVQREAAGSIQIRTYERGVEQETLACGTGATAAAIAAARRWQLPAPLALQTRSGQSLRIDFAWNDGFPTQVFMAGPANLVFKGSIDLADLYTETHS